MAKMVRLLMARLGAEQLNEIIAQEQELNGSRGST